jgi:hypothetical protein
LRGAVQMLSKCSCACGHGYVEVSGSPVLRFKCHCTICQSVYGKPFADIVALRSNQVARPVSPVLQFRRHRLPPAVSRGTCSSCNKPVVGFLPLAPFFGLAFVPAENFPASVTLPEAALHTFYDRRVADVHDELPKISGYWTSQWAVSSRFMCGLMRR